MSGSDVDLVKFEFHALVTVDDQGVPCGEASTDLTSVLPDGRLSQTFDYVSGDGFGIAQVSFEIEVPRSRMWYGHKVIRGQLLDDKSFIAPPALEEPRAPAIINADEPEDDDWESRSSANDDDDFGPIDFGEFGEGD